LGRAFEFGERGEVPVDDAVPVLEKGVGELEGFAGGEPGGSVAD
jgi:hypothetical protein